MVGLGLGFCKVILIIGCVVSRFDACSFALFWGLWFTVWGCL